MYKLHALIAAVTGALCVATASAQQAPQVHSGFTLERIATVPDAREIAVAGNGDLFAGTAGHAVYIVRGAQGAAKTPQIFARLPDSQAASVVINGGFVYFGTQFGIWRAPYRTGDSTVGSRPKQIAAVRTSGISRDHLTTTLAITKDRLYASVGSTCDVCDPDVDATRATIAEMRLDGGNRQARALHIRNAIALTVNPATGVLWAGVAGQDELAPGHPYELFDAVTLHPGVPDYGWPYCYENRRAAVPGKDCSHAVIPRVIFPAYETPIGATFYPAAQRGRYAFPAEYRGGAFVTLHGSWHRPLVPPRVVFVPMRGDRPARVIDWNDPAKQWTEFAGGFQSSGDDRIARPTGIAVGPDGSLFFADDLNGGIYRIRPSK